MTNPSQTTVLARLNSLNDTLQTAASPILSQLESLDDALYEATGANGSDPVRRALWECREQLEAAGRALGEACAREAEQPSETLGTD